MTSKNFREEAHKMADRMANYLENIESFPVKPMIQPGDILSRLPDSPPESGEEIDDIMVDFDKDIMPGITHWQNPNFFAYFPATSSEVSVLGEMLTAAIGAQCMMWVTSPAAAELEEKVMEWLKQMLDLPSDWHGSIQDTASTATLCAIITAREVKTDYEINNTGFDGRTYRVYTSAQAHSSVEKAGGIAGIGRENVVKIEVDSEFAMRSDKLEEAILQDLENGFVPLCIVGALGTTGSTAIDPIDEIGEIAKQHDIWYHIDAAYAGSAFIINEFRKQFEKLDLADSFVFNPHKWMFTNFDCSVLYVKDKASLVNTFSLTPEYLRTREETQVNNYKDWGIQLGRRFRALKLWMVIRSFGVEGIRQKIQGHIDLGKWFANQVENSQDFELLAPVPLNTVCFRFNPGGKSEEELNKLNEVLMHRLNDSGDLFLTHTKLNESIALRLVAGQTNVAKRHVENAWNKLRSEAGGLV